MVSRIWMFIYTYMLTPIKLCFMHVLNGKQLFMWLASVDGASAGSTSVRKLSSDIWLCTDAIDTHRSHISLFWTLDKTFVDMQIKYSAASLLKGGCPLSWMCFYSICSTHITHSHTHSILSVRRSNLNDIHSTHASIGLAGCIQATNPLGYSNPNQFNFPHKYLHAQSYNYRHMTVWWWPSLQQSES